MFKYRRGLAIRIKIQETYRKECDRINGQPFRKGNKANEQKEKRQSEKHVVSQSRRGAPHGAA